MSQDSKNNSQKVPKDVGVSEVCWDSFKLHRTTGNLHQHEPRSNRCPGSDKPPTATSSIPNNSHHPHSSSSQPLPRTRQQDNMSMLPDIMNGSTLDPPQPGNKLLSHPPWTRLISRIPRAARANCRLLPVRIIGKIIVAPNNSAAWNELLNFGPVILSKPKRGGANRNLSNIINKRIAAWDKEQPSRRLFY